ncbi:MAG TPA: type I methionyl aminopeptidase [Candidatus Dormibacteraeota bacterium]|nr:type I methionyl aminopeptidase [Candidatus Dormibacteraeota bacterium]
MTFNHKKTSQEIEAMRQGGRILAEVLGALAVAVRPGITTGELNDLAHEKIIKLKAKPAFLGYQSFPASICISINNEIVHGIPGSKVVSAGDIVTLDLGVTYKGLITDSAITVAVGKISPEAQNLLKGTKSALVAGIKQVKPGNRIGDISAAIQAELTKYGLSVIHDLSGHGVGREVHEEPPIPNFGRAGTGMVLEEGMTLAIEPMASLGSKEIVLQPDGWTYTSADGSLTAQFEHTVAVTADGHRILTQ